MKIISNSVPFKQRQRARKNCVYKFTSELIDDDDFYILWHVLIFKRAIIKETSLEAVSLKIEKRNIEADKGKNGNEQKLFFILS